jgi:putative FmdB family regulatory protein
MPTYEYACAACGHKFERFQNMSEGPLKECPQCGGSVNRLITGGAAIILKGDAHRGGSACSLGETGRTCCGRDERCGAPPCRRNE